MIKPELKYIEFPNLADEGDWSCAILPEGLAVYAFIGPIDRNASESFYFRALTLDDLSAIVNDGGRDHLFCKNVLVVSDRNLDKVRSAVNELCSMISGDSWDDVSRRLSLYGEWEYEGYREA